MRGHEGDAGMRAARNATGTNAASTNAAGTNANGANAGGTVVTSTTWPPRELGPADRFVGRTAEWDAITGLFGAGRAMFAVVEGDPGIGKSRLLRELTGWAVDRGAAVLTGRATEFGRFLPFELLFDVLADVGRRPEPRPGDGRGVGELLDRLAAVVGGLDGDRVPEPVLGVERHQLYRSVRDLIETAAQEGELAILVDDVQWADAASLELIDYLVRHPPLGPVVIVLAAPAGHLPVRLNQSLGLLGPDVVRVTLGPLSPAEVDEWLAGESPSRRRRLYEAGCGNPLYLEILSAGDDRAVWELGRSPSIMDDRVAVALDEMIRTGLRAMPEDQRLVAAAAAVAGENFDPAFVAHVADLPLARVSAATDTLVDRDVLRSAGSQLVFRHPLVRAAAYGLAGPAWRLAAHGRAAAYLAELGEPPSRQAPHLEQAFRPGDVRAAAVLAEAAGSVLETAPSASTHWLHAALRALPDRPDTMDTRRQWLLLLARALTLCGKLAESKEILQQLVGAPTQHRFPALELLAANERLLGRLSQARAMLLAELARTDGDEVPIRLELAATEVLDGALAEAERHASAVLRLCEDDPRQQAPAAAASTLLALVRVQTGGRAAASAQLAHAQWAVDGLEDAALRGMLDLVSPLAWIELMAEQYDDATRHLDRGVRVARRYGRNHVVPEMYVVRSVVHGRVGRVTEALRDAEDAEEIAMAVGGRELHRFATVTRLRPLLWRNGPDEARAVLTGIRYAAPLRSSWWRASAALTVAEVALELGEPQLCRSLLDASGMPASRGSAAARLRARVELADGDLAAAGELLEVARELAQAGGLRGEASATALLEAELLAAGGRVDEAIAAGQTAVAEAHGASLPVREGQARVVLGDFYHRAGDQAAGREQLGIAKGLFQKSGADWLAAQATNAQRRMGAGQPRTRVRGQSAPALSSREREIAQMVAAGMTNRAIADQLFLSPRTVEAHVARIFTKLGVSSRAAVARLFGDAAT